MKTFVIGDIHGRYKALKQVLKLSKLDYENDKLILLGDIVDGGINTYKVVEELLKIKNVIFVLGNHDQFFIDNIKRGWSNELMHKKIWINQGGANTLNSYRASVIPGSSIYDEPRKIDVSNINIPVTHRDFFNKAVLYYIENDDIFVHGGFNPAIPKITSQSIHDLLWDRRLIEYARSGNRVKHYNRVFVGHTTTQNYGSMHPIRFSNLIMMDCGAGWTGKLAIMDIDTEKYWLSDTQKPEGL